MKITCAQRFVGIVTNDALLGATLYQSVITTLNAQNALQPDVVIYSPAPSITTEQHVNRALTTMRMLGVEVVVFPDSPAIQPNRLSTEDWCNAIIDLSRGSLTDERFKPFYPDNQTRGSVDLDTETNHAGFIAIHGGLGPEAGNDSFRYLAERFEGSLLLLSVATVPDEVTYLLDIHRKGESTRLHPLPRLRQNREMLANTRPDCLFMACNTAHYYHADLVKGIDIPTPHIIEVGLRAIPHGERALVLATEASIVTCLYQRAQERCGRKDLSLILPDPNQQENINRAIWDYIVPGHDHAYGGELFKKVIDHYGFGNGDGYVIAGCTEVILGLDRVDVRKESIIDNAKLAADEAMRIVAEKVGLD